MSVRQKNFAAAFACYLPATDRDYHAVEITMRYHLITFVFLALAIGAYFVGAVAGVALFIVLGFGAEAVFWIRLLRRRHSTEATRAG